MLSSGLKYHLSALHVFVEASTSQQPHWVQDSEYYDWQSDWHICQMDGKNIIIGYFQDSQ